MVLPDDLAEVVNPQDRRAFYYCESHPRSLSPSKLRVCQGSVEHDPLVAFSVGSYGEPPPPNRVGLLDWMTLVLIVLLAAIGVWLNYIRLSTTAAFAAVALYAIFYQLRRSWGEVDRVIRECAGTNPDSASRS